VAEVDSAEIAVNLGSGPVSKSTTAAPEALQPQEPPVNTGILQADNGNAVAAGFREAIARGDAGITAGEDGYAQILFQARDLTRQNLFRISVPYGQIPS